MSSTEELAQYEITANDNRAVSNTGDPNKQVIPRDISGLYGVHVSNFSDAVTEKELRKTFSAAGNVRLCRIIDLKSSQPGSDVHSYAFVKFSTHDEARMALSKFNGFSMGGYTLAVRPAYQRVGGKRRSSFPDKRNGGANEPRMEQNRHEKNISDRRLMKEIQQINHNMGSTDYRLRERKLLNDEVMIFNSPSGEHVSRSSGRNQLLPPRFQKKAQSDKCCGESFHTSKTSITNCPQVSLPLALEAKQHVLPQGLLVSMSAGSPTHYRSNLQERDAPGNIPSVLRPFQPTCNQEQGVQEHGSVEQGITAAASTLSHLELLSKPCAKVSQEEKAHVRQVPNGNGSPWKQMEEQTAESPRCTSSASIEHDRCLRSPVQNNTSPKLSPISAQNVPFWSIADVVEFFRKTDCADHADFFQEQEIDGKALMLLNRETLLHFMKVGPMLKVLKLVDDLRSGHYSQAVDGKFTANGW